MPLLASMMSGGVVAVIDLASPYPSSTAPSPSAACTEARELLTQFAATGKQAPFEEIVRRYGGMVFNTAFEITHNRHDAEDATQAAFLSLAVQAKSGREVIAIGPWLQQVTRRLALDINRSRKRRRNREDRFSQMWEERQNQSQHNSADRLTGGAPAATSEHDELRAVIQEELAQIPPKYRMPLILHYFGGLSRDEMARELNCRANTLGVRLHRGREMLGKRLAKRGVALSGIMIGIVMAEVIRDVVSETLIRSTAHAASLLNAGHPYACGTVSAEVIGMARHASSAIILAKVKVGAIMALIAGTAAAASAQVVQRVTEWTTEGNLGRLFKDWFKSPDLPTNFAPRPSLSPQVHNTQPPTYYPAIAANPPSNWTTIAPQTNWLPQSGLSLSNRSPVPAIPAAAPLWTFTRSETLTLAPAPHDADHPAPLPRNLNYSVTAFRHTGGGGGGSGGGASRSLHQSLPIAADVDFSPFHGPKHPRQQVEVEPPPTPKVRQLPNGTIVAPRPPVPQHIYNPNPVIQIPDVDPIPAGAVDVWIAPPPPLPDETSLGGYLSGGVRYVSTEFDPNASQSFETIQSAGRGRALMTIDFGEITSPEVVVGHIGTGVTLQTGGSHTVDSLYLGVVASGRGLYELRAGILNVTRTPMTTSAPHIVHVGAGGEGVLLLGNQHSTGTISETGYGSAVDLVLGGSNDSKATLYGWGKVSLSGVLTNNGHVTADGYDRPRTLELKNFTTVTSQALAGSGAGWYATRQGKLALPPIAVDAGTHTYTWGDSPDRTLTLLNSARATLIDVESAGTLEIALLALDRPDIPILPDGHQFIGVWSIDAGGLVAAGGIDLSVRYDDALAGSLGLDESILKLWKYDQGEWIRLDFDPTFLRDPATHTLGVQTQLGGMSYFGVSAPEPGTCGMIVAGFGLYLCQRRRRGRQAN